MRSSRQAIAAYAPLATPRASARAAITATASAPAPDRQQTPTRLVGSASARTCMARRRVAIPSPARPAMVAAASDSAPNVTTSAASAAALILRAGRAIATSTNGLAGFVTSAFEAWLLSRIGLYGLLILPFVAGLAFLFRRQMIAEAIDEARRDGSAAPTKMLVRVEASNASELILARLRGESESRLAARPDLLGRCPRVCGPWLGCYAPVEAGSASAGAWASASCSSAWSSGRRKRNWVATFTIRVKRRAPMPKMPTETSISTVLSW